VPKTAGSVNGDLFEKTVVKRVTVVTSEWKMEAAIILAVLELDVMNFTDMRVA